MRQKSRGVIQIFLPIILALVVIAGIGYYSLGNGQKQIIEDENLLVTPSPTSTQNICELNKEYQSNATVSDSCECPQGYIKKFTITGFGPCPRERMRDCPSATFKCIIPTGTPKLSVDDVSILGIRLIGCCSCPEKVTLSQIGKNGWIKYEEAKDYSDLRPKTCNNSDIQCSPCPPIDFSAQ